MRPANPERTFLQHGRSFRSLFTNLKLLNPRIPCQHNHGLFLAPLNKAVTASEASRPQRPAATAPFILVPHSPSNLNLPVCGLVVSRPHCLVARSAPPRRVRLPRPLPAQSIPFTSRTTLSSGPGPFLHIGKFGFQGLFLPSPFHYPRQVRLPWPPPAQSIPFRVTSRTTLSSGPFLHIGKFSFQGLFLPSPFHSLHGPHCPAARFAYLCPSGDSIHMKSSFVHQETSSAARLEQTLSLNQVLQPHSIAPRSDAA